MFTCVTDTTSRARTLVEVLHSTVARDPAKAIFARRSPAGFVDVTAAAFGDEVTALAKGFVAAGVQAGDRVGIMSKTRYEWTLVDFALWTAGAVGVPIYETSSPGQVAWILGDAEDVGCVVESRGHAGRVAGVRDGLPALQHVWTVEDGDLATLAAGGADVDDAQLAQRAAGLSSDSLATLIYTSGTTGRPKGCMLTHGNFVAE